MTQPVLVEIANGVAEIVIDHPPLNLIDRTLYPGLIGAINAVANDETVRAVVLRSAVPDFFMAHFDVALILQLPTDGPEPTDLNSFQQLAETLRTMPKPTIAVIEGRCGGGGSELALSCDLRIAGPRAVFNQPEVGLGILPGGTGTSRLTRLAGRSQAIEVILGCEDTDAERAAAIGWVNRVEPDPLSWARRFAQRVASFPPSAVAAAKAAVLRADGDPTALHIAEGAGFSALIGQPETRAAMESFLASGGQTVEGESSLGSLFDPPHVA
jgi:enoyl-CoA hydratase/carnithine racemase